jgi:cystathionine beta-lyase
MPRDWQTALIHSGATAPPGFRSLVTPVYRGSTTLFADAASVADVWDRDKRPYTYGLYGTPTTLELAARLSELEHGYRTFITPGGQAALALIYFAFLAAGRHVLIPQSVYGPSRDLATSLLTRFGVEVEFYSPLIGGDIEKLLRPSTSLVWCESPGSVTMEVQDVPAIAAAAHRHGVLVALDNTWSAGIYFDAFKHGVDVSMQALTKYVGGHSDLLLGSVTVRERASYQTLGPVHESLGFAVSPDDCSLALRGLQTLGVRLRRIEETAGTVAGWLSHRTEIATVLHPGLPSCPGHEHWARDFSGATGVFSIVFTPAWTKHQIAVFLDSVTLFKIGYSWGGVTSLAVPYPIASDGSRPPYGDRLVRLNIGLEDAADLIADLSVSLDAMQDSKPEG